MDIDEARIWLEEVVKGELAYHKTIKAIEVILRSYNAILTNYNALEEDMDKLLEESISKDKIIDKIKEIRDEYDERIKDNDSFYAYSNEYAHIEEVLRELLEEGE